MIVLTLARKPLIGSVAANVLKHGTGGINIDGTRLQTGESLLGGAYAKQGTDRPEGYENWRFKRGDKGRSGEFVQPSGRWPANLILGHQPGCEYKGMRRVFSGPSTYMAGTQTGGYGGKVATPLGTPSIHYADPEGFETVAAWNCTPVCPVRELDRQGQAVGIHSAGNQTDRSPGSQLGISKGVTWHFGGQGQRHGDIGGASRFFKQAQAQEAQQP